MTKSSVCSAALEAVVAILSYLCMESNNCDLSGVILT